MVKCQRTEMWNAHMFLITCVIWSWSVRPWASPYNHPLDDLRIAENAVYLHLCQRISSLELSSVFPLKGCHKSGEDNQSFYFLLERWIWEPFPRLGTEKVWILNPRLCLKSDQISTNSFECFPFVSVWEQWRRFGLEGYTTCFWPHVFFPRSRHISELKKWAACQIVGSSSSCNRDICKQSVTVCDWCSRLDVWRHSNFSDRLLLKAEKSAAFFFEELLSEERRLKDSWEILPYLLSTGCRVFAW